MQEKAFKHFEWDSLRIKNENWRGQYKRRKFLRWLSWKLIAVDKAWLPHKEDHKRFF